MWSILRQVILIGVLSTLTALGVTMLTSASSMPNEPLPAMKSPGILVEKAAHRLTVYDGNQAVRTYRAAFGTGVADGDKEVQGDGRTPEGLFYVCMKNPRSKYTLSLGLSYPNIEHARRGLRDKLITQEQYDQIVAALQAGQTPPWDTRLGGEIMIHGKGSQRDWTAGCVAMDDSSITELYSAIPVGTPVQIAP